MFSLLTTEPYPTHNRRRKRPGARSSNPLPKTESNSTARPRSHFETGRCEPSSLKSTEELENGVSRDFSHPLPDCRPPSTQRASHDLLGPADGCFLGLTRGGSELDDIAGIGHGDQRQRQGGCLGDWD